MSQLAIWTPEPSGKAVDLAALWPWTVARRPCADVSAQGGVRGWQRTVIAAGQMMTK